MPTMIPYILFFLAGLGFGFSLNGLYKWGALLFPLVLALFAFVSAGIDSEAVLELLVALGVTAGGVLLGTILGSGEERAQTA